MTSLPTHLVYTEYAGYVASDTWYTLLEAGNLAPALAIGRLPAQTADQLTIMVNKIIAYEQAGPETWTQRALLVADDEPAFDHASNNLAAALEPTGYQTQKLYMTENEDIHDTLISALNQGVGILNYVGHGSIEVWGDEKVFESEDAAILINGNRLPIFTTFTCLNGYFNHPQVDAMPETLLWPRRCWRGSGRCPLRPFPQPATTAPDRRFLSDASQRAKPAPWARRCKRPK